MTYTTVHKDYFADTLGEAAEAMLRDSEVWDRKVIAGSDSGQCDDAGRSIGYAVESWVWCPQERRLRVHFR